MAKVRRIFSVGFDGRFIGIFGAGGGGGLVLRIGERIDIIDIILRGHAAILTGAPTATNAAKMKDNTKRVRNKRRGIRIYFVAGNTTK